MANAYIQVPPQSTGLKVQTFENSVGGQTVEAEAVVLVQSSDNTEVGVSGQPLRVDPTGSTIQPVSGTVTANIGTVATLATAAKQDTGNTSLASIDGKITAVNTGAVVVSSSALPSGAATGAKQDTGNTSVASIDTKTPALGQALAAASVPVVLTAAQITTLTPVAAITNYANETGGNLAASATSLALLDDTVFVDDTATHATGTTKVIGIGAVAVPTDTAVNANDIGMPGMTVNRELWTSLTTAIPAGSNAIGKLAANTGVTIGAVEIAAAQTLATVTTVGTVSTITNVVHIDDNSGSITVDGNVGILPVTSGGCSDFHLVSAATDNATNVKASAGQVYGWHIFNNAGYPVYVKFHNTAGTPTAGSGVVKTIGVQAGMYADHTVLGGMAFSTGIAITIVQGITDASTTAVAASDCVVDIEYK